MKTPTLMRLNAVGKFYLPKYAAEDDLEFEVVYEKEDRLGLHISIRVVGGGNIVTLNNCDHGWFEPVLPKKRSWFGLF
jgi:hypothetical protein